MGDLWRAVRRGLRAWRSYVWKRRSRRECADLGAVLRGTGCARRHLGGVPIARYGRRSSTMEQVSFGHLAIHTII